MTTERKDGGPAPEDFEFDETDDTCPNCGGEGVYYDCMDEIGCIDPESGCDLCARRCDWCNPRKPQTAERQKGGA
jgi:alpha-D-ribose 1-methylphosphonate 5-phosphate C-P lyase